ncbi:uncharacterized protein LOC110068954 isoform X2 [Orbicella faveolata]|uniref:uncharacterized protein LOC110068954 isoform X2 n=1 Tax=Orbicella faveolata TaxID=48498 RepID=UPI0009E3C7FF|nr:uncharacterized protein LOC110068954 isoform X2 [Orbicella faveolata]
MKVITYLTYLSGKWVENLYTDTLKNLILMDTAVKLLKDATAATCTMTSAEVKSLACSMTTTLDLCQNVTTNISSSLREHKLLWEQLET